MASNRGDKDAKTTTVPKKKLILSKPPAESNVDNNEKKPIDIESMLYLLKKLSNEVVDFNKNARESTSKKKLFRSIQGKVITPLKPPEPSNLNLICTK